MNFKFRNNKDNDIQKNHYKAWLISALAMLLLIGIESFTDFPYREKTCLELFEEIKLENPEASIDSFACHPGFITPKTIMNIAIAFVVYAFIFWRLERKRFKTWRSYK